MAKKENKKPALKAAGDYSIATGYGGKIAGAKSGVYKDSYDAAGGGKYGNVGDQNTGFSVNWSKVDYGKSKMEELMKNKENYDRGIKDKPEEEVDLEKNTTKKKEEGVDNKGCKIGLEEWDEETQSCQPTEEPTGPGPVVKDDDDDDDDDDPVDPPVDDPVDPVNPVELSEKELTSDVYNVKTATKLSLANLFKNGKIKKGKPQYSKEVQDRMKANFHSARTEITKLKKDKKNRNSEASKKKIEELEKIKEKNNHKNRNTNLLTVTLPNGEKEEMSAETFETDYADMFELKDKGGRKYKGGSTRGGRDYMSPVTKTTMNFRSPFARRDRTNKNLRQNWIPQQTPMNYGSPLHQEQPMAPPSGEPQQFGDIWEKVGAYGKDMPEKVDKFIKHVRYNPEVDLPINSFQNQEWTGIVTKWLQGQKASMVKARNSKNNDEQQKIAASVNVLIQDITVYSGKFEDWIARNSGDQAEGNAGGSVVSEGSKKDERFIGNITFMGDKNTTIAVGEDGKLGIKSYGLDEVKYIDELDQDVFAKDDVGYAQFIKISEELQKNAEQGKPLNENVVKGNADQLLKNKDSVLSWAFDPLYGQSWLQDYAAGDPNANLDVFMPESPSFDIDYLTDELHGWLSSKLTEAYEKNVPQEPEKPGGAAQGIMDKTLTGVEEEKKNKEGVYAEGGEQPQGPPQEGMPPQGEPVAQAPEQGSPMGYISKSQDLIRKYRQL